MDKYISKENKKELNKTYQELKSKLEQQYKNSGYHPPPLEGVFIRFCLHQFAAILTIQGKIINDLIRHNGWNND